MDKITKKKEFYQETFDVGILRVSNMCLSGYFF